MYNKGVKAYLRLQCRGWVILKICSLPGHVVRVGYQDQRQVRLLIMSDIFDGHEGVGGH